ncbi:MAG TPA: serine hydrolase domain-containing protein [Caulobacter sp.]|nr:serine hydrolase domain-containing protein [Caulobacter sp.]
MRLKSLLRGGLAAVLSFVVGAGPMASFSQEAAPALPSAPIPYTPQPKADPKAPPARARAVRRPAAVPAAPPPAATLVAPVAPLDPAQLEAYVDGLVVEAMAGRKIAGVTVSVVQNGQVVLKKGYGHDRLQPARRVDPDRSLFRLASISKTFTWIAVMRQVEAGRMRLTDPINLYLPESVRVHDQGFAREVRMIDLMNHRPGFEDRAFGQLFEKNADRVRPQLTWLKQERPRRVWEPGTIPAYSNYGTNLAGAAVSRLSGKPFEQMIEQEITGPLGMARTTFRDPYPPRPDLPAPMPAHLAADLAEGYFWTGARFAKRPYEFTSHGAPAGGASSTAADMARYMIMLLNGGALDGATIFGPQTSAGFRTVQDRVLPGAGGFAHGFMTFSLPGGRTGFGHNGATLTFRSNMTIVPDLGLGVFVAVNTEGGAALTGSLASRIVQRFYVGGDGRRAIVPSQWLKDNQGAFSGQYLSSRRAFHGMEKFIGLFNGRTTVSVDGGQLVIRSFGDVSVWTPLDREGRFQSTSDSRVIAFRMENGRAVGWYDSGGATYSKRVGLFGGTGWLIWLAVLTGLASLVTLGGALVRLRLNLRQTTVQARASLIQTIQAVLWLIMLSAFGLWFRKTGDVAAIFFDWPGALLITASACGFVAAVLSLVVVGLTPFVWQGGRRVDSFTQGRKLRFTFTALVFLLFSILLAFWGAIFPWAS